MLVCAVSQRGTFTAGLTIISRRKSAPKLVSTSSVRQTEDHAVALPAPIERHHKAGSISGSPEPCNPKAERSVPTSNHGPAFLGDLAGRLPEERAIGEQPNITGWRFGKQVADCDLVVVICHVDGAGARSQILDRPARSSRNSGGERHLPHPECSR